MVNPMELTGRVIVITGASSGLGRDISVLISELGGTVILVGRRKEQLDITCNMLTGSGHRVEPFDLCNVDDIPGWLKNISGKTGPLDGVVHSAGIEALRPLKLIKKDSFNDMMNINVSAAIGLTKGFRQKKVNRSGGSIVYISSAAGMVGQTAHAEYCASKAALIGLCKAAALELAREKIRVNCISPGLVKTELTEKALSTITPAQLKAIEDYHPFGIGVPRDVSNAVAFLLADTGRWITGATLVVDGGYTAH